MAEPGGVIPKQDGIYSKNIVTLRIIVVAFVDDIVEFW
jgi:hypothetical protein